MSHKPNPKPQEQDSPEDLQRYQEYQDTLDLLGECLALKVQAFQERWGDPEDMGAPWNPSLNLNDATNIIEQFIASEKNSPDTTKP